MEMWKKEYDEIEVPIEMKEKVEESIQRARQRKKAARNLRLFCRIGSAAAIFAIVLILPNTSRTAAAAMQQLPILGEFFKVVTFREYQVEEGRNLADVKIPEIVPDNTEHVSEETAKQAQQTAEAINIDIQKVTEELIEEFKNSMEAFEDGYQDLHIDSTVLADNEKWFSLQLVLYQGAGSGYERHRHYTIDKTTGKRALLSDFYGDNYVQTVSESVKKQMRKRMAEDENVTYWIDYDEVPAWNFESIAADQDFYVNAEGKVVICFDEYEVAPGYMGCVEFIMEEE